MINVKYHSNDLVLLRYNNLHFLFHDQCFAFVISTNYSTQVKYIKECCKYKIARLVQILNSILVAMMRLGVTAGDDFILQR